MCLSRIELLPPKTLADNLASIPVYHASSDFRVSPHEKEQGGSNTGGGAVATVDCIPTGDPTFNLDCRELRRLIIEDVIMLEESTRLLLLISQDHPSFDSTFAPILRRQLPHRARDDLEREQRRKAQREDGQ